MAAFLQDYYILFMIALLSLCLLILFRSIIGILIQLVFFVATMLISLTGLVWLVNVLLAVQIVIGLFLIYQMKKAIDYNFQIALEKTHLVDRYYTKIDYSGSENSFLL